MLIHLNVEIVGRAHICHDLIIPDGLSDFHILRHIDEEMNAALHEQNQAHAALQKTALARKVPVAPSVTTQVVPGNVLPRIFASFHHQAWIDDNAVDVDPMVTKIDITAEVIAMGREAASKIEDGRDSSDVFQFAALAPDEVTNWDGPFRICAADAIEEYFNAPSRIIATFIPKVLKDGIYSNADVALALIDVTEELTFLGKTTSMDIQDDSFESNVLRECKGAPDWVKQWSGPFSVNVAQSVEDFYSYQD